MSSDHAAADPAAPLAQLLGRFPGAGRVRWLGVRPGRRLVVSAVQAVEARAGCGLAGDHYRTGGAGKRQVTLIQGEHLAVIGALLGEPPIDPSRLRRNVVVDRINLLALKGRRFRIGDAVLEGAGPAHPCSRMEEELGEGGYNAMRGHGGLAARIIESGWIRVGDAVVDLGEAP